MVHKLEITCNQDLSTMQIKDGIESYEYHFLLTTRKQAKGIDIDEFIIMMNHTTHEKWRYKELCQDKFFILISRIASTKKNIVFEMGTDFVPLQDKYIKEINKEE